MTPRLQELLLLIRQHDAFQELLGAVEAPCELPYRPSKPASVAEQQAEWIYRSGRRAQHDAWRAFLTETDPARGIPTSQKEQS